MNGNYKMVLNQNILIYPISLIDNDIIIVLATRPIVPSTQNSFGGFNY